MEITSVFELAKADAGVQALLASGPKTRFYGFGEAPQNVVKPYAIWQLVGGFPENKLAHRPDEDTFTIQIDAYGDKPDDARSVGIALRSALELDGYLTSYNFEGREPDTRLYRFSFTMEFMMPREVIGS